MKDYTKIIPYFWLRGTGKELRGDPKTQVLALYLMSSPHSTILGIYYIAVSTVSNETGLSHGEIINGFQRLESLQFAYYDHECELVWIPNLARYNVSEKPLKAADKRCIHIRKELDKLGDHKFTAQFRQMYTEYFCM